MFVQHLYCRTYGWLSSRILYEPIFCYCTFVNLPYSPNIELVLQLQCNWNTSLECKYLIVVIARFEPVLFLKLAFYFFNKPQKFPFPKSNHTYVIHM